MIPVVIVPVISKRSQVETLLGSLDAEIGRLVIVDQVGIAPDIAGEHIRVIEQLGFAGAVNLGIAQTPAAPWWLWASDDLTFGRGDLAKIEALMADPSPRVVTGDREDDRLLRCAYGAINQAAVVKVGLFDEWSFFPAYFEDDDLDYRCDLADVEWVEYNGNIEHRRSSTLNGSERWKARNAETFRANLANYVAKWGGRPGQETFRTPWNLPAPLSFSFPDPAGRAARLWGAE